MPETLLEQLLRLLVEQSINLALAIANYVYIVQQGKIVYDSTPAELAKDEKVKEIYIGISR